MRPLEWTELPGLFPEFPESDRWLGVLQRHSRLVDEWRVRASLTAVPNEEGVRRNYAESLEMWRIFSELERPEKVADIGPGAGFPGVVGAAVFRSCEVHLVEPRRRKAAFLKMCADVLEMGNVAVHAERAEEAGRGDLREQMTTAVARAVAPIVVLLEYAAPLLRVGGLAVFAKGSGAPEEVARGEAAAGQLGLEFTELVEMRALVSATPFAVVYRKVAATPERFPRRPGVPGRRPIS